MLSACGKKAAPRWVERESSAALTGLQVHYRPDRIVVEWKHVAGKVAASKHVIMRSVSEGDFQKVAVVDTLKYVDHDISPLLSYRYKIVPADKKTLSSNALVTKEVGANGSPPAPADVNITVGPKGLTLTWEHDSDVSGYNVYRSAKEDVFPLVPRNKNPIF